jgi:hypothetical protein
MNHDDCISTPDGRFSSVAHTHEGQKGWWLFPGEADDVAARQRLEEAEHQRSSGVSTYGPAADAQIRRGRPGPRTMAQREADRMWTGEDAGRLTITECWAFEDGRQAGLTEAAGRWSRAKDVPEIPFHTRPDGSRHAGAKDVT